MLSCREVVRDADQLLAGELTWQRRLSLQMHLLMCHHCRRYIKQLRLLIRAVPFMHAKASDDEVDQVMAHVCSGDNSEN